MQLKLVFISLLFSILIVSCVHQSKRFAEFTQLFSIHSRYTLDCSSCDIEDQGTKDDLTQYKVVFNRVIGGTSRFIFTNMVYDDHDAHKAKRLRVFLDQELIDAYSIERLESISAETIIVNRVNDISR